MLGLSASTFFRGRAVRFASGDNPTARAEDGKRTAGRYKNFVNKALGLSNDDKKKLFVKFARLSARPTASESSTGLGLSIVKTMVEAMNGTIWCESELGQGAMFVWNCRL